LVAPQEELLPERGQRLQRDRALVAPTLDYASIRE
jgi:hypothetical protein